MKELEAGFFNEKEAAKIYTECGHRKFKRLVLSGRINPPVEVRPWGKTVRLFFPKKPYLEWIDSLGIQDVDPRFYKKAS